MLLHLLYPLSRYPGLSWLNVIRYPSTRIIAATLSALVMSFLLGPWFIRKLQVRQIGQSVRDDGPSTHLVKAGTPTMGGSLILLSLVVPTLLWSNLSNKLIWLALVVTVGFGAVGFIDDALKVRERNSRGLPGRLKMIALLAIAAIAVFFIVYGDILPPGLRWRISVPLVDFERYPLALSPWLYFILGLVVVVGSANAVNLTDGLDGLAIGPIVISAGTFLMLSYAAGTVLDGFNIATYLHVPHVPGAAELAIFCGSMAGAGVGFLWYNTYPASVFMGDIGSLSLGGALGVVALLTKNEFVWIILGGIFVLETVSVIIQVVSFKTRGKRVFRMAPMHHHFELKGWAEPKIIVRFWIISIILALVALATLKLR